MTWPLWLAALAPLSFLTAALAPERVFPIVKISVAAASLSLAAAMVLVGAAAASGPSVSPLIGAAGLGLALRVDLLSAVVCTLIAFIGLIVIAYSRNYLAGDPRQARFIRGLCLTLGLVQGLVLAGNLAQLVLCWAGVAVSVNRLLLFRAERQAAVLAARKHLLVSGLAWLCLILAAAILWRAAGSGDIGAVLSAAKAANGSAWSVAAVLLALSAAFSSAQLPFHGWILEVMETPTPVSALLHAGVVNAGGYLILRFSDLVSAHPAAMGLLAAVGAASALFGSLVMLTQTSVKAELAYSTIAQMGFMLLECGLGAFSAALLHIVAHALYKAHAFLSAGGAAAERAPGAARPAGLGAVLAIAALMVLGALAAAVLGVGPAQQPGAYVLWSVLLLGLARVWSRTRRLRALALPVGLSVSLVLLYVAGQALFARILPGAASTAMSPGPAAIAGAVGLVVLMTGLMCAQLMAPGPAGSASWARAYALVSSGFCLNTFANRWVLRFWPARPSQPSQDGAAV